MALKDDLKELITKEFTDYEVEVDDFFVGYLADNLWDFLADRLGPAQEKLMNDLAVARQRATTAESREAALEEIIADLQRRIGNPDD